MFYSEAAPSDDLTPYIMSFWEFAVPENAVSPYSHEIFPDGCASLFYFRNLSRGLHVVGVSGLHLEAITKPVSAGDTFWGMRIAPAACRGVLRVDPATMTQDPVFAAKVFPHLTAGLTDRLTAAPNFEAAISIFESMMRNLATSQIGHDTKVAEAVRFIEQDSGEIRISELAGRLDLSTRQLQRRFKSSTGLSPKQFARIRRIRATAVVLVENERVSWADRAADMGFADQSHMTHEFKSVTKRSPNSFAEKVGKIKHGDLVK
jgi:AraC-like DNA-binding protein